MKAIVSVAVLLGLFGFYHQDKFSGDLLVLEKQAYGDGCQVTPPCTYSWNVLRYFEQDPVTCGRTAIECLSRKENTVDIIASVAESTEVVEPVRIAAIRALSKTTSTQAAQSITRVITNSEGALKQEAIKAIGLLGLRAVSGGLFPPKKKDKKEFVQEVNPAEVEVEKLP